jgi:hypothetical protein
MYANNTKAVLDWVSPGNNATGYNMTWVDAKDNFINRLSEDSCPLYKVVHKYVKESNSWKEAREYYYTNYF